MSPAGTCVFHMRWKLKADRGLINTISLVAMFDMANTTRPKVSVCWHLWRVRKFEPYSERIDTLADHANTYEWYVALFTYYYLIVIKMCCSVSSPKFLFLFFFWSPSTAWSTHSATHTDGRVIVIHALWHTDTHTHGRCTNTVRVEQSNVIDTNTQTYISQIAPDIWHAHKHTVVATEKVKNPYTRTKCVTYIRQRPPYIMAHTTWNNSFLIHTRPLGRVG